MVGYLLTEFLLNTRTYIRTQRKLARKMIRLNNIVVFTLFLISKAAAAKEAIIYDEKQFQGNYSFYSSCLPLS